MNDLLGNELKIGDRVVIPIDNYLDQWIVISIDETTKKACVEDVEDWINLRTKTLNQYCICSIDAILRHSFKLYENNRSKIK